jgi:hypothetical protein
MILINIVEPPGFDRCFPMMPINTTVKIYQGSYIINQEVRRLSSFTRLYVRK